MRGGFGWKEQAYVTHVRPLHEAISTPGRARGTKPSLLKYRGPRLFQGPFGACVAFTEVRGIYVSLGANGHEQVMGSPKHAYAVGRQQEHAGQDTDQTPPLTDKGMFPGTALVALQRNGFCQWEDDPYGSSLAGHNYENACKTDINKKVTPRVAREAFDQSGLRWYDLELSTGRMDAIEDCFAAGMPVPLALHVDKRFLEHRSAEPIRHLNQGEIVGGHMMLGIEITSEGHLLVDNWWDDWGFDDGFGVLHRDLVNSSLVRNAVALLPSPTFA
jgi:hypothetical protein